MKIRELEIHGLRNFPPAGRVIRFVDAFTDQPRQLTVLVGSNGSGKTTVLEMIAEVVDPTVDIHGFPLMLLPDDAQIIGSFQHQETDPALRQVAPSRVKLVLRQGHYLAQDGPSRKSGRVIYMPCNRRFEAPISLTLTSPTVSNAYVIRVDRLASDSLAQFWLWQNYLDLEAQAEGRPNLAPFIDAIEDLLGHGQRVRIKRGRITIERPHLGDVIRPHELPSGELQILALFGELLRHLRPGAIVLIDELEISLHPALQRAVIHKLRALARKHDLQVIVTTHSMEIVSAVAPDEVISLDDILLQEGVTPGEKAG